MKHETGFLVTVEAAAAANEKNIFENNSLSRQTAHVRRETSVINKKLPNVFKSCPQMISLEK